MENIWTLSIWNLGSPQIRDNLYNMADLYICACVPVASISMTVFLDGHPAQYWPPYVVCSVCMCVVTFELLIFNCMHIIKEF